MATAIACPIPRARNAGNNCGLPGQNEQKKKKKRIFTSALDNVGLIEAPGQTETVCLPSSMQSQAAA